MNRENEREIIHCLLQIQSPVHIGCDEVYEPTGFVVDRNNYQLVVFDATDFIARLSEQARNEFSAICRKGTVTSILEIFRFMLNHQAEGHNVEVANGLIDHLDKVRNLPVSNETLIQKELNQFKIERTTFNPNDGRPVVPGSAVKGALRTAWLNSAAAGIPGLATPSKDRDGKRQPDSKKLENILLDKSNIEEDPFRLVKVSDFHPVGKAATKIYYAVNRKKSTGGGEARGPYQILEAIQPGARFLGSIRVEKPQKNAPIKRPLSLPDLLKSLEFFQNEKGREDKELAAIGVPFVNLADSRGVHLLRLGRHSGAESLTIERHRQISVKGPGGKYTIEKGATTLWLASESSKPATNNHLLPFGFATFQPLEVDSLRKFEQEESDWRKKDRRLLTERLDQQRAEREQKAYEARLKEESEAREKETKRLLEEAEARRRAALESMSPAEREAVLVRDPVTQESMVYEIYGRLQEYQGEDRLMLAQAFKEYFQMKDKWTKKMCSKKQWEKVLVIKSILGEN